MSHPSNPIFRKAFLDFFTDKQKNVGISLKEEPDSKEDTFDKILYSNKEKEKHSE